MNWQKRLKIVCDFYYNKTLLKLGTIEYGELIDYNEKGIIELFPLPFSGIWGYEGDSIKVLINGNPYKSEAIIKLNLDKIIECND